MGVMKKFWQTILIAAIVTCTVNVTGGEIFSLELTSADMVKQKGGVLAPETQFSADGMTCLAQAGKIINYCSFPADGIINPRRGTIELVFKPSWKGSSDNTNCLFNTGVGVMWGERNTFHIQREGNNLKFVIIDNKSKILVVEAPDFLNKFNDGKFHHVAATWDADAGLNIYVDGVREGNNASKFESGKISDKMYVGNNNIYPGGQKYYSSSNTVIKSIRISDTACQEFKNIAVEPIRTVLYPADHGRESRTVLMHNLPVHLLFFYYGQNNNLTKAELQLEMPEKIKPVSTSLIRINSVFPDKPVMSSDRILRNGKPYIRYHIEIAHLNELCKELFLAYNHAVYLEPEADMASGQYEIFWQVNYNGKPGTEKRLTAEVIAPLKYSALPENFQISLFFAGSLINPHGGGFLMYHADDNDIVGGKLRDVFRNLGISFGRKPGKDTVGKFVAAHADWLVYGEWAYSSKVGHPRKGADGKDLGLYACPTYIAAEGFNFSQPLVAELKKEYASQNIKFVMPDFELERVSFQCFCGNCIKSFGLFANINPNGLTPDEILHKHNDKWSEFLCRQNAAILAQVVKIIRAASSEVKIYLCAGYVFDHNYTLQVGHDVTLFDDLVDAHMPMIYYSGTDFYQKIEATCSALKKPVIPHICVNDVVYNPTIFMQPDAMRMSILATFASGGKGVAFYPGADSFDAEYYKFLNRSSNEIVQLEPYLKNAFRNDKSGKISPVMPFKIWEKNGEKLLCIFNYGKKKIFFKAEITLPSSEQYSAGDLLSNKRIETKQNNREISFLYSISPNDAVFILVSSDPGKFSGMKLVDAQQDATGFNAKTQLPVQIKDKQNISMDGSKLKITTGNSSAWIDFESGARLWQWQIESVELINNQSESSGGMFQDLFYPAPGWGGEQTEAYEITDQESTPSKIVVLLSRRMSNPATQGIVLNKRYIFNRTAPEITVEYEWLNQSGKDMKISPWIHNSPLPAGKKWALYISGSNAAVLSTDRNDNIFYRKGLNPAPGWEKDSLTGYFNTGTVNVFCRELETGLTFNFDFSTLQMIYIWNGGANTLEFIYAPQTIPPGKSWKTAIAIAKKNK